MRDNMLKNMYRRGIKLLNKGKYEKYVKCIQEQGRDLPDFTLLTSDCMGGLIYHTLNSQFLSPTINMSIKDEDFLKLVSDLPFYLGQDIHFLEWKNYPVSYIGEGERAVELRFEHYKTESDAIRKWNERKARIVDNAFVICADQDLSDEDIQRFRDIDNLSIKRKIMFTWRKDRADGKEIVYVKPYGKKKIKNYSKLRPDGFRDYELFFDYTKWLRMENDFMLE